MNNKYNKSKTYLLPLLMHHVKFDLNYFKNISNTYIFDEYNIYKKCIIIEYDFKEINKEIESYIRKVKKEELLLKAMKRKNKIIFIFLFPKERKKDYKNFIIGKYSAYKKSSKSIIINFHAKLYFNNMNAIQFLIKLKQVLFKSNTLKKKLEKKLKVKIPTKLDLLDRISISEETFKVHNKKLFK